MPRKSFRYSVIELNNLNENQQKKVAKSKIKNILTMKLEAKAEHILNGWMFFLCENAVLVIFLKY